MAKNTFTAYQRTKEKFDALREDASMYFENNKDLVAASEFEAAMALGCFDKEFMYFATAYQENNITAYRVSSKEINLQKFVEQAVTESLYPTPVKRFIKRTPCPSGQESAIRRQIKIESAKTLSKIYPAAYFEALAKLSGIEASNSAYSLLSDWRDELDGVYDIERLALFQSLLLNALESKVLTVKSYLTFATWLKEIYKQLEDDIIAKGLYKKILSGFAYTQDKITWQYFYDAKLEVTYNEKASKEQQGYWVTPIFTREKWLRDMSEFRAMRENFITDFRQYCTNGYLKRFLAIKDLPGVINRETFETQLSAVAAQCPPEAVVTFTSYYQKWNVR